jgi:peptidoglycan/xylan/chitin deacetylase (PgdA/CDA1 family)
MLYPPHGEVPRGSGDGRLHVCLTFDLDAVSLWTATFRSSSPSDVSRGEFGPAVAIPRILGLLADRGISATFFVPAVTARQFRSTVEDVVAAGHEVAAHGDLHERVVKLELAEEADVHRRSVETLAEVTGAAPRGFRAPGWEISPNTIGILEELGFAYDSSQMGSDFVPYRARRGDMIDGVDWAPGVETDVWEIPVSWELDDFPPFFIRPPAFLPARSVRDVEEMWREEFDYAVANVPRAVFTLTMHPQIIGRGPRLEMVDRVVGHMAAQEGVRFATLAGVVDTLRASPATGSVEP